MTDDALLGPAGYVVTGSGGGGEGGAYMFASLEELDGIIAEWTAIRKSVMADGDKLSQAQLIVQSPAADDMSRRQVTSTITSITNALKHNANLHKYADMYLAKLKAAREQYGADDGIAAARMRSVDA